MEKLINSHDACELTTSSHSDVTAAQVLKHSDTFLLVDRLGAVGVPVANEQGLYCSGTRYLSRWHLTVGGQRPMLLNSTMQEDNSLLIVQMTTPDLEFGDGGAAPHGTLHLFRSLVVYEDALYEHLRLANYSGRPLRVDIEYQYGADYRDIFEIRGAKRQAWGSMLDPELTDHRASLGYIGLDNHRRYTTIEFDADPSCLDECRCLIPVQLEEGGQSSIYTTVRCTMDRSSSAPPRQHASIVGQLAERIRQGRDDSTSVITSNERFNQWLNRSFADLAMLASDTPHGSYPYAGVPWFAAPFGRDGIITALETLWCQPELAKGTLRFLAHTQATELDPESEAEPGKIVHEMREGEMANLGEIPFGKYYGTVDATPLFVMLAGETYRRTGDRELIESMWDNIRAAIEWIDRYGDVDGDGFVEYESHNSRGLVHQCWKDSNDSIYHADGEAARGAIAVSEVQGYVYAAKLHAAEMSDLLGDSGWAQRLRAQATELKRNFNAAFWVPHMESFAIALDGDKRPCEVRNSNVGHLLYSGIVDIRYAPAVCNALTESRAFSGWGIRTISEGEARYNPMSYHNGSVWPHDTAICIAGMSRYGFRRQSLPIVEGLYNASLFNELHRLPELFCGFERMSGHGPTLYPVACSPQAWAAGSAYLVLQSMLGLSFSPIKPQIRFDNPELPSFVNWIRIENLRIGNGSADLVLRRHPRDVGLNVERKEGDVEIVVMA